MSLYSVAAALEGIKKKLGVPERLLIACEKLADAKAREAKAQSRIAESLERIANKHGKDF